MAVIKNPLALVQGNTDPKLVWHGIKAWETFEGPTQILPEVPIIGEFDLKDTVLYALKPDRHIGEFEIHLVYHGVMEVWVDTPAHALVITRGGGLITRPGQLHGGVHEALQPARWMWIRIAFPPDKSGFLPGISSRETNRIKQGLSEVANPTFRFSHELGDCMRRLLDEHRRALPGVHVAARGIFLEFLVWLHRDLLHAAHPPAASSAQLSPEIKRGIEYADKNLGRSFSIDQMADAACLSASQFRRLFHEQTGQSPHDYLVRRRVECSKEMLKESKKVSPILQWTWDLPLRRILLPFFVVLSGSRLYSFGSSIRLSNHKSYRDDYPATRACIFACVSLERWRVMG